MSYYDDSSLFVAPNGYKTSVLFAQKPMDANGQLAFTRSNDTATRVAENGLIEKVRRNLLTYSNDFSNAAWTKVGGTTLTGSQSDPFGGSNAWKWEATGAATIQLSQNPATSNLRTASIYAKAGNVSTFSMWRGSAVTFNLSTGTITSGSGTITSVGGGWYRCSVNGVGISHNPYFTAAASGNHIFVAFAQIEDGDIETAYIPTTTAAVSVGPVANTPRIDYTGGGCGKLLLEPQRTNVITFSESFDNAAWTKSGSATTITANSTVSPSGYQDADTWTISSAGARYVSQTKTLTAGAVTASFFVKKGTSNWFAIYIVDGGSSAGFTFNVSNGTLGSAVSSSLTPTASIQDYGNGWYRCVLTATVVGTSIEARGYVATSSSTVSASVGASVICWGAMLEQGSYSTSYINTLAAAVTRGADACVKTGISSLIGQTEGTLFVEFSLTNYDNPKALCTVDVGATTNFIAITINSGNPRLTVRQAGSSSVLITPAQLPFGNYKIAVGYKSGDYVMYINGVQVGASSSTVYPVGALIQFVLNNASYGTLGDGYNQALLFKTRLSNSELASLTTL